MAPTYFPFAQCAPPTVVTEADRDLDAVNSGWLAWLEHERTETLAPFTSHPVSG